MVGNFIARDNPVRAVNFIKELREKLHHIGQNPLLYQLRPEVGLDARIAVFGRYIILFRIIPARDVVRVERVVSGYRDLPALTR